MSTSSRLQELQKKRRLEREAREAKEAREREKAQREAGKQLSKAQVEFEEQEMKRIAEARRREKEEDRRRKQRIREEIAKDRAERQARSKSETTPVTAMQPPQPAAVQAPPAMKEHTEARLQVHSRLPNVVKMSSKYGLAGRQHTPLTL